MLRLGLKRQPVLRWGAARHAAPRRGQGGPLPSPRLRRQLGAGSCRFAARAAGVRGHGRVEGV